MRWPQRLRYTRVMEVDPKKITAILKMLNDGKINGDWVEQSGFHVMSAAAYEKDGTSTPNSNLGVTLKMFFNVKTGETKFYVASKVVKT